MRTPVGNEKRVWRRAAGRAVRILVCALPLLHLAIFVPAQWRRTDTERDVSTYVRVADRVRAGESMYAPYPPPGPHDPGKLGPAYVYPPFLATALALLPEVPYQVFANAWLVFLLVCLFGYAAALGRLATGRFAVVPTMAAATLLLFFPGTYVALSLGQFDAAVWCLAGLGLAVPRLRGAAFAAGALTKVFPVWALGAAIWRERYRVVVGAGLTVLAATAVAVAVLGPGGFLAACVEWFRYELPSLGQGQMDNLTVTGMPDWLPVGNMSPPYLPLLIAHARGWNPVGDLPAWLRLYLTGVATAAPLLTMWLARHRSEPLQYALVLCAAVVFSPIFRLTYIPLLYLVPAAALGERRRPLKTAQSPAGLVLTSV